MYDQSEELPTQPQRQSIITEEKQIQMKPTYCGVQIALHGFTEKQEITHIQTLITKQLSGTVVGLPSKLTAGRGNSGQGKVIVVSKDGGYNASNNLTEVVNQQWLLDSV